MTPTIQSLPWRFKLLTPATWLFFGYLYIPIIILFVYSFNDNRLATIWTGFSFRWYVEFWENDAFREAAANSIFLATCASTMATILATLAALALRGRRLPGNTLYLSVLSFPLIVPEIVTAVATLIFFLMIGIPLGMGGLILAHTVFCIPFAFLPINARMTSLDPTLEHAAGDLYAKPWEAFIYVTMPLLWPGILSGAILAFIISLDDFVISLFIASAGSTTLPIFMFGMIRLGVTPEVNAISVAMLAISILFVVASYAVNKINAAT